VYSKSQLKEATRQGARVRRIEKPTSSGGSTKRDSLAQKQTVEERVRRAKYNYESNPNEATKEEYYYAKKMYDSTITGVASAQEVDQKSSVKKALTYKDGLSKDTYNPDEAMDVEIDFKFTDAYDKNSKLKAEEDEFNNAVTKYAKFALELYTDIAVNILSADEESSASPRNQVRVRSFLDKLKRYLNLRGSKIDARKLPKLQAVVASLK
jgi:hypothetical protein